MSWKNIRQRSITDVFVNEHNALKELDEVQALIDWSRIEKLLSNIHTKLRGEEAWPPLMMFKAMLLQMWYGLSDPQLEKQLARDLLFRRFIGLSLSESVPDHSTLWRFRNKREVVELQQKLFDEINDQLSEKGLIMKQGEISIVDASVVKANRNRPNKGVDGKNTQDPEAGYSVKIGSDGKQNTTYGYKAHLGVDEDGFIKGREFTAGNVHDSQSMEEVLEGTESEVYGDSAYASEKTNNWLQKRGIKNKILERNYRNNPLNETQKANNRIKSRIRCGVERVFGILKLHYSLGRARYLGRLRNKVRFNFICMAYNLKRGVSLGREIRQYQESCV